MKKCCIFVVSMCLMPQILGRLLLEHSARPCRLDTLISHLHGRIHLLHKLMFQQYSLQHRGVWEGRKDRRRGKLKGPYWPSSMRNLRHERVFKHLS